MAIKSTLPRAWIFRKEGSKKIIGRAPPEKYKNADAAMHGFRRECADHFDVYFRDSKGVIHSCADESTPEDFP